MYIPVKAGRLATGSYGASPIHGHVFGPRPTGSPNGTGGLVTKPNSDTVNVLGTQFDTATQQDTPALTTNDHVTKLVSPTGKVAQIGPHERGSVLRRVIVPVAKRQFGGSTSDNQSDTPFHPRPQGQRPRVQPTNAVDTSRLTNLPASFASRSNLWNDPNNSFYKGKTNPSTGTVGKGRWSTTKQGVV